MKKMLMLTIVLGLAALSADWMGLSSTSIAAADNIPQTAFRDIVPGIQPDDGSVCIVFIEIADVDRSCPAAVSAQADIVHQLPDAMTIVLLGFGGLLYRRRKE